MKITSTVPGCAESFTGPTSPSGLLTVPMPYGHYVVCADQAGKKATTGTTTSPVKNIVTGGVSAAVDITTTLGSC